MFCRRVPKPPQAKQSGMTWMSSARGHYSPVMRPHPVPNFSITPSMWSATSWQILNRNMAQEVASLGPLKWCSGKVLTSENDFGNKLALTPGGWLPVRCDGVNGPGIIHYWAEHAHYTLVQEHGHHVLPLGLSKVKAMSPPVRLQLMERVIGTQAASLTWAWLCLLQSASSKGAR